MIDTSVTAIATNAGIVKLVIRSDRDGALFTCTLTLWEASVLAAQLGNPGRYENPNFMNTLGESNT